MSIRSRLKSAEQRVGDYTREQGDACECRYVELEEGEPPSEE